MPCSAVPCHRQSHLCARAPGSLLHPRHPEVGDLQPALGVDQNVLWEGRRDGERGGVDRGRGRHVMLEAGLVVSWEPGACISMRFSGI